MYRKGTIQTVEKPISVIDKNEQVELKRAEIPKIQLPQELQKLTFGLGWDKIPNEISLDLDLSAVFIDQNKKIAKIANFQTRKELPLYVQHTGDNRTGEGEGDDETIIVDITKLPKNISEMYVTVTVFAGCMGTQKNIHINTYFDDLAKKAGKENINDTLDPTINVPGVIFAKVDFKKMIYDSVRWGFLAKVANEDSLQDIISGIHAPVPLEWINNK